MQSAARCDVHNRYCRFTLQREFNHQLVNPIHGISGVQGDIQYLLRPCRTPIVIPISSLFHYAELFVEFEINDKINDSR